MWEQTYVLGGGVRNLGILRERSEKLRKPS